MPSKIEVIAGAMELSAGERAELARQLILSLESDSADPDADEAWEIEIERRLQSLDNGEAKLIDWKDSVERARRALRDTENK